MAEVAVPHSLNRIGNCCMSLLANFSVVSGRNADSPVSARSGPADGKILRTLAESLSLLLFGAEPSEKAY